MSLSRNRFGNSPFAVPASSMILIALMVTGYFFRRISFGFTVLVLVVLPLAISLAMNTVKQEQQSQRRFMQIVVALSLAAAAILTAIHLLHR